MFIVHCHVITSNEWNLQLTKKLRLVFGGSQQSQSSFEMGEYVRDTDIADSTLQMGF